MTSPSPERAASAGSRGEEGEAGPLQAFASIGLRDSGSEKNAAPCPCRRPRTLRFWQVGASPKTLGGHLEQTIRSHGQPWTYAQQEPPLGFGPHRTCKGPNAR